MLTIEYDPAGLLEVTIDKEGIDDLMRILGRLPPGDHEHLFTPSWGAYPLTEESKRPHAHSPSEYLSRRVRVSDRKGVTLPHAE